MVERLNKENFDSTIKSTPLALVDFYSDSCIPCKKLNPVLGDLEDDEGDEIKLFKLNINFDFEVSEKYGVASSPTLILFKSGSEIDRKNGFQTFEILKDWIDLNK